MNQSIQTSNFSNTIFLICKSFVWLWIEWPVLDEIGTNRIDTLIVSFPEKIFAHESLPKDVLMPLWSIVQRHIDAKVVGSAGLADFNADYLEQFVNALDDANVNKIDFSY